MNKSGIIRNCFIVFLVSGLWHGANWTFLFWGALNAFYFIPLLLLGKHRKHVQIVAQKSHLPTFKDFISILSTFALTTFAFIFFRSDSISNAFQYIARMFQSDLFSIPKLIHTENTTMIIVLLMITFLLVIEWFYRRKEYVFQHICNSKISIQISLIAFLTFIIFLFSGSQQEFIYFQF